MKTVFVYGPPGCGKTKNSKALQTFFGCNSIVQDDAGMAVVLGALHLFCDFAFVSNIESTLPYGDVIVMPFEDAMKAMNASVTPESASPASLFSHAIESYLRSPKATEAIEKAVEKTVNAAISENLSAYSDFGKAVETKVRAALAIHGNIDLPSYNDTVLRIVSTLVERGTRGAVERQVAEQMKEILTPAPESITVTGLVDLFREHVKNKHDAGCVCHGDEGEFTVLFRKTDYGSIDVFFDPDANVDKTKCDIHLGVSSTGSIYWLRFRDGSTEAKLFSGPFYGFERTLFQMKAAGTKLVFDVTDESELSRRFATVKSTTGSSGTVPTR